MLRNLHVSNFLLIDECDIEFGEGLHILSGETGAGKSILLGALNIALGSKVPKDVLLDDSKDAIIEATFLITTDEQRNKLSDLEIPIYDDEVILSRRISQNRTTSRINGETFPAGILGKVGTLLIDIYGQNEYLSLNSISRQLKYIDEFDANVISPLKERTKQLHTVYINALEKLENNSKDERELERERILLEHEIEEISEANIDIELDASLEEKYHKMSNIQKIMSSVSEAYEEISSSGGASELVSRAIRELSLADGFDSSISNIRSSLLDVESILSDTAKELSDYISANDFEERDFYELESRINILNRLTDKYGPNLEDVLEALETRNKRLEQLDDYDTYIEDLKHKVDTYLDEAMASALELSNVRKQVAKRFCEKVSESMQDLNFTNSKFEMVFSETEISSNGIDSAEFIVSTNAGSEMRPLKDVASGGEMSRIMLAIKTIAADEDDIETLIFDEIDSGISGRTADSVAHKLYQISRGRQVICITHLPQIASMADNHYLIFKDVVDGTTRTSIEAISEIDRENEVARMLGGSEISEKALDNARDLISVANRFKEMCK